jgi:hypothetical protein
MVVSPLPKARPHLPDGFECAVLLLCLLEIRNKESPGVTRVRFADLTLRKLWGRDRISPQLMEEIQQWLWRGGWTLFHAQSTYAAIRTTSVLSWNRLSSKPMANNLKQIREGSFDYERHYHLVDGGGEQ